MPFAAPRYYHTKRSKTDKDKCHMILLICGILKKEWYKWTYSQNRNRLPDIENKLMASIGDSNRG